MKLLALSIAACIVCLTTCLADGRNFSPAGPAPVLFGWQDPTDLPHRYRDHCYVDAFGQVRCQASCGAGYQFYYCSKRSFGCCHVGLGYCDWNGFLRCRPSLFVR